MGMLAFAPAAHATFPGNPGKIAFYSNRGGNVDIYTQTTSIAAAVRLTTATNDDVQPNWSPDGTKIVFTSIRDGNYEIYSMNENGSNQTNLTNNAFDDVQPCWSPDGTKIAFVSLRDGNPEIYTMNPDGSGVVRLTNNSASEGQPSWSPDGTKIAFQSNRTGNLDVFKMNPDGTSQTNLTNNAATDENPDWTPDATKIYFDSNRSGQFEIQLMNADGSSVVAQTSDSSTVDVDPVASLGLGSFFWESTADGPDHEIWGTGFGGPLDYTNNATEEGTPNMQPLNNSYARPKAASPLRVSLVPAYKSCNSTFAHHRGSLSPNNGCYQPTPESNYLTMGTFDFNGQTPNSVGFVRIDAVTSPTTDGAIRVSYTDVRCQKTSGGCSNGALSDYADDLRFTTSFKITDKGFGPFASGFAVNGTSVDVPLAFSVPCTTTASTTTGSNCSISTSLNAQFGGSAVVFPQRAIWQLNSPINLYDGGADGVASTTGDNTLFAVGGLFFP
jgi:TolB protein